MAEEFEIIKNIFNSNKKIILLSLLVIVLIAGNLIFGTLYFLELKDCQLAKSTLKTQQVNIKVANFAGLFIEKVLKAQNEVSFEERLKLENAVRELNDVQILEQWQKFISSKTEQEAQSEVKNLLSLLISKVKQ